VVKLRSPRGRAPTRFGEVSFRTKGTPDGVRIDIGAPRRAQPARIIIHLPRSRRLLGGAPGVQVVYRPDQSPHWDFETVVREYLTSAPSLD